MARIRRGGLAATRANRSGGVTGMKEDAYAPPLLTQSSVLVVRAGSRVCAIALQHVSEIMRPLPIEAVIGAPTYVRGVSVIRGVPTPVVDLEVLLGGRGGEPVHGRFVTVRCGERRVVLGVGGVVGIRDLASVRLAALPPLLGDLGAERIEAIGAADAGLLVVLRTARIVPDDVWLLLSSEGEAR